MQIFNCIEEEVVSIPNLHVVQRSTAFSGTVGCPTGPSNSTEQKMSLEVSLPPPL